MISLVSFTLRDQLTFAGRVQSRAAIEPWSDHHCVKVCILGGQGTIPWLAGDKVAFLATTAVLASMSCTESRRTPRLCTSLTIRRQILSTESKAIPPDTSADCLPLSAHQVHFPSFQDYVGTRCFLSGSLIPSDTGSSGEEPSLC